ncbi:MAG TPA: HAD hydrolase family protein [Actinomycetales bacterium]|nr:HAD hydrolase family protein [Actinomycetales bacterium]
MITDIEPNLVSSGGLAVRDLLLNAMDTVALLDQSVSAGQWSDAFLLSAGLLQLIDDALHPDPLQLRRAASYLGSRSSSVARAGGRGAAVASSLTRTTGRTPATRQLLSARPAFAELATSLARMTLTPAGPDASEPEDMRRIDHLLAQVADVAPLLCPDVIRLPACFRDFDLHPDDVVRLADGLAAGGVPLDEPVRVVGVRTGGTYLAPLLAAALQTKARVGVPVLTYRPGRPFLRWERRALQATVRACGRVVLIDDPPATGTSLSATLHALGAAGVPEPATSLVLPLFDHDLPASVRRYPAVTLPWPSWSVHARLEPAAVGATLSGLLGGAWTVAGCERRGDAGVPLATTAREHIRARYRVELTDGTGRTERREIAVEGAGLGYFGGYALAVAGALPHRVPAVYGLVDGLLFRDWLPEAATPPSAGSLAGTIASYVAERERELPVDVDPTWRMRGREPVWEICAELLSRPYGWGAPGVRWLLEASTRRLLAHDRATVVDGDTRPSRWLPGPTDPERLLKIDFHQGSFSHWGLSCYDPAFDLAGAASQPDSPDFPPLLREAYEATTGERVDEERWLLYRLAHLWRFGRAGELLGADVERYSAAAIHDFLAACYLADLAPAAGPLCAIDLDGVLETDRLGYACTTPTGMGALRALAAHDYRVLLVTGRGLQDARDRCSAFRLAGAVAEYGTVVYAGMGGAGHRTGTVTDLRTAQEQSLLERVGRELARRGATVEPTHHHAVRARVDGGPLPAELIADVPLLSDPGLRLVHGQGQTDVTADRLDKGAALAHLAHSLGTNEVALAVGDTGEDLSMLSRATIARAPANADAVVRASGVAITRHAYQAGLADAVADLIGHRPGTCSRCRPPDLPPRTRSLLAVLGLSEPGRARLPLRTLRVALSPRP